MKKCDFIAEIEFVTTEKGGRKNYAKSGYRPPIEFENYPERWTSGMQHYIGKEKLFPGEKTKAEITIYSFEYFKKRLYKGMKFNIREGIRIVGYGKIIKFVNLDLEIIDNDKTSNNLNLYPKDILEKIKLIYGVFNNETKVINEIQEFINLDKTFRSPQLIRAIFYLFTKGKYKRNEVYEIAKKDWRDILLLSEYDKNNNRIRNFNNEFGKEKI